MFATIVSLILLAQVQAYDKELTFQVDAGKNECFYHYIIKGESIDVEYQVIDGGHGDLDINFSLLDPAGIIIVKDFKKPENSHRYLTEITGDYEICFDNTFSSFNRKTVFFEIIVERDTEPNLGDEQFNSAYMISGVDGYNLEQVVEVMNYVIRIRMKLSKARQIQEMLRSHESRDRNLAESNFSKVNYWSLLQMCAMVAVGFLQVFLVRSIFDTNTRMTTIWRKL